MPEVVLHGGLVDRHHVGRELRLQRVRAEGAERHGGEQEDRSEKKREAGCHDPNPEWRRQWRGARGARCRERPSFRLQWRRSRHANRTRIAP